MSTVAKGAAIGALCGTTSFGAAACMAYGLGEMQAGDPAGAEFVAAGVAGGGARSILRGPVTLKAPTGVPIDAKFAQKTYGPMFSIEGTFSGKSVEEIAAALRSGAMSPAQIEVNYIVRGEQAIILNTRSSQALEVAGIPRSQWNGVNRTGDTIYESLLNGQIRRNPGGPFDIARPSERP